MIILKVTKKQDFILSPENTFLEPQRGQFDPTTYQIPDFLSIFAVAN